MAFRILGEGGRSLGAYAGSGEPLPPKASRRSSFQANVAETSAISFFILLRSLGLQVRSSCPMPSMPSARKPEAIRLAMLRPSAVSRESISDVIRANLLGRIAPSGHAAREGAHNKSLNEYGGEVKAAPDFVAATSVRCQQGGWLPSPCTSCRLQLLSKQSALWCFGNPPISAGRQK